MFLFFVTLNSFENDIRAIPSPGDSGEDKTKCPCTADELTNKVDHHSVLKMLNRDVRLLNTGNRFTF